MNLKLVKLLLGIIGKPNSGKTTILNALANTTAKSGNYPFTTIKPNRGVGYVKINCACQNIETNCQPRSGRCESGHRFVPVEILDVAGLVPGASSGKGMGNQFLDDLRQANGYIHVIDISSTTDSIGTPEKVGDPVSDIRWLEDELTKWILRLLFENWTRNIRRLEANTFSLAEQLFGQLAGLGVTKNSVEDILRELKLSDRKDFGKWDDNLKFEIASLFRKSLFKSVIAANKIDKAGSDEWLKKVRENFPEMVIIPTSGLAELALKNASEKGYIEYLPGESNFKAIESDLKELAIFNDIQAKILDKYNSTGVYSLLSRVVFEILDFIPVFPIEDLNIFSDAKNLILPDVFLIRNGTTVKNFAKQIHSDFYDYFLHAIIATTGRRVGLDYVLQYGDVVKIISSKK